MTPKKDILSKELFETIISEVINKDASPYNQLTKKANDIDTDYFEDITRDEEVLALELNPELKEKVVAQFKKMADELLFESSLENRILSDICQRIETAKQEHGEDVACEALENSVATLRKYAQDRLLFITTPEYRETELKELYNHAQKITLIERVMRNNKADVIDFHHSLMNRTEWECKVLIERRISHFLEGIAHRLEQIIQIH